VARRVVDDRGGLSTGDFVVRHDSVSILCGGPALTGWFHRMCNVISCMLFPVFIDGTLFLVWRAAVLSRRALYVIIIRAAGASRRSSVRRS